MPTEPKKDAGIGSLLTSEKFWLPVISGIGGMLASPSVRLPGAIGSGLLSGAGAYAATEKQQSEIAKREAEREETLAKAAVTRASLYERFPIRGEGQFIWDKSNPYAAPIQITDTEGRPITPRPRPDIKPPVAGVSATAAAAPAGAKPVKTTVEQPVPPGPPAAFVAPTAAGTAAFTTAPSTAPAATAIEEQKKWSPITDVNNPNVKKPPNLFQISTDKALEASETSAGIKQVEEQRESAKAAYGQLYRMDEMDKQFANLPTEGFLAPGAYAKERQDFAKTINGMLSVLHGTPAFDPNQVAANEALIKDTFRLGTELVKGMGREPGFIVQAAVQANPGIEITPMAYRRIMAGLRQAAEYEKDRAAFFDNYFSKYGTLSTANEQFARLNPPENYARRAILSTIPEDVANRYKEYVAKSIKDGKPYDKATEDIEKNYGKGTAALILGM
jgi:hypothetical protein